MQRIPQIWPDWQADELIGQGAYGKVYKASRDVGGHVLHAAIKIIDIPRDEAEVSSLRQMGMDALSIRSYFEETAQSVINELVVMDSLKGAPNVVHVEDYQKLEREDGVGWSVFIRMELLEDLPSYQARTGLPSAREVARIGVDVCRALGFCHAAGVIHRDVKPENVFHSDFGGYKLGDFGLARRIDEGSRSTKSQAGSGPYMAPEVMTGHYDETVDVYSLGVMLYRWLNGGKPPFIGAGETPTRAALEDAQVRRLSGELPPLPAGEGVDPALATIVLKAVAPKPKERWQSATEFGEALQAWLDGEPVDVEVPKDEGPVVKPGGYNPLEVLGDVEEGQGQEGGSEGEEEEEQGPSPMDSALAKVKEAWRAYEAMVDWDDEGDIGEMDTDEFHAVWTAMEELEACLDAEREKPGSMFRSSDPEELCAETLESVSKVVDAYHAYVDADHVSHGNVGVRSLARAVNKALGIRGRANKRSKKSGGGADTGTGVSAPPADTKKGASEGPGCLGIVALVIVWSVLFSLSVLVLINVPVIGTIWLAVGWIPCLAIAFGICGSFFS